MTIDHSKTPPAPPPPPRGLTRAACCACLALLLLIAAAPTSAAAATFATTDPATAVHHTSAVLNGHFDPGADPAITDCYFDWGTDASYGATVPCAEGNSFAGPEDVSANLGGLTPNTTYHYRLHIATTASGDRTGADRTATPAPFPLARRELDVFGPDGTSATAFAGTSQILRSYRLTFDSARSRLYLFESSTGENSPGSIYGFDASTPHAYLPLAFNPLPTVAPGAYPDLAVDQTSLSSAGRFYFASDHGSSVATTNGTDKVYGFTTAGDPIAGNFPIDPLTNPGGFTTTLALASASAAPASTPRGTFGSARPIQSASLSTAPMAIFSARSSRQEPLAATVLPATSPSIPTTISTSMRAPSTSSPRPPTTPTMQL